MTGLRKLILNVHLWIGMVACLLLFLLGTTGAILVFEYPLDHLLNRSMAYVTPQPQRLPLTDLAANVKKAYPDVRVVSAELSASSPSPDLAYTFGVMHGKKRLQVFVNQYTGQVLGIRDGSTTVMQRIHQLHTSLLSGPAFRIVTTWGSLLLCITAISGIYLWWPRKIFRPNMKANGRRINFDLHNSIGFYASIFVFIFAFTAVVIHWDDKLQPVADFVTHSRADEPDPKMISGPHQPGEQAITLDRAYEIASATVPGARVTMISMPARPNDIVRTWMKFPDDGTPAGRTWLYIDQYSGQVLWERNAHTAPLGTKYVKEWNREIHTGDIFGWPSKIIAMFAALSVAFLSISGPLIWIWKKTGKKKSVATAVTGARLDKLEKQGV